MSGRVIAATIEREKKETRQEKGEHWKSTVRTEGGHKKLKTHGISPVKHHHRTWVGGYVHDGQLSTQAVIQEGLSGGRREA